MHSEALRDRLAAAGLLVGWPEGVPGVLTAVTTDSRRVEAGALFVAYAGTTSDGHAYLPAAAHGGAAAAIVERAVGGVSVPQILVSSGRPAAAVAASLHFGDPAKSLEIVGVTGTNGKTTTVHLLRHLLGHSAPAGSIGTLGAVDGRGLVLPGTGSLTTPGPVELLDALAQLGAAGVKTVALEASSHSLDQDRLWGLRLRAAVFTNLTRDHLDYHRTEEAYLAAKLRLVMYLAGDGWTVTNADDPAWVSLAERANRLTFGIKSAADVRATEIAGDEQGTRFTLAARGRSVEVRLPLIGRYNVENALAAAATALALGRELDDIAARLSAVSQVPGRMERLTDRPCVVLRDYAHTPDALERALAALGSISRGRVIAVFGCGGDRDRGKRPVMGGIAAREADLAIVTSDNPRTENPERILDEIEAGMGDVPHLRIADRRQAIARALAIAGPEDTVLLAGKGHETYQVVGTDKLPFDERDVVAEAMGAMAQ